jgi:hypothetical protein
METPVTGGGGVFGIQQLYSIPPLPPPLSGKLRRMFGEPRPKDPKTMCGVIPNTPYHDTDPRPRMPTSSRGVLANTQFDLGATHSVVNANISQRIIKTGIYLQPSGCQLTDVQGNRLTVIGTLNIPITVLSKTIVWPVLVIPQLAEKSILGSDFMHGNGI